MSTTPPRSLAQPNQLPFKTPQRASHLSLGGPQSTPGSRGSAAVKNLEGDTGRVEGYDRGDYDDYITEDLESRVFVDFEVFLHSALHVPRDWETKWGPAIEAVKADEGFIGHHKAYRKLCEASTTLEKLYYEPLVASADAILRVVSPSKFDGISGTPQYYRVSRNDKLRGGVMNKAHLSPDLVVLHNDCQLPRSSKKGEPGDSKPEDSRAVDSEAVDNTSEDSKPEAKESVVSPLNWANALHALEVKAYDTAICDGGCIPRLIVNGKHVPSSHRGGC
jgi:hypothetical protein